MSGQGVRVEAAVASHRDGAIRVYVVGEDGQGRREMALAFDPADALKLTVAICTAYADWFRETEMQTKGKHHE